VKGVGKMMARAMHLCLHPGQRPDLAFCAVRRGEFRAPGQKNFFSGDDPKISLASLNRRLPDARIEHDLFQGENRQKSERLKVANPPPIASFFRQLFWALFDPKSLVQTHNLMRYASDRSRNNIFPRRSAACCDAKVFLTW
jgi:hypothetical protein